MKVELCFSPALYPAYESEDSIVVVVDIFRASTTMCAAIANGAKSVIPVDSIEIAKSYKDQGYLVGAERNVKRVEFADFGNTPSEYSPEKVRDKDVVFTTTNGTHAIETAKGCYRLIIGAFSNLSAIADYCAQEQKDVLVLCSGWKDRFNIEDSLFGGALADKLIQEKGYTVDSDAVQVALSMWTEAKPDLNKYIQQSEHIKRLAANNLLDVAQYCLRIDTVDVVPVYNEETKQIN
ncbi:2-phosphosulfolactate phosphatase [Dysgonomonas sp. 520]|uniref:2-phosphosulfolactate phosphatase n=1 Tax=Dysgonomonas sp. 520 TaxID=2302931 RepID=UPI0013D4C2D9|nr:2-phosphosulfolactate phosphatase [Dysgonomonas sp. 520]NDW08897.1 2-phosphosulfolactate phosphatase [Dysgonomonas sp. 520]